MQKTKKRSLVRTVNGNIYNGILINITQREAGFDYEFFGLEAYLGAWNVNYDDQDWSKGRITYQWE